MIKLTLSFERSASSSTSELDYNFVLIICLRNELDLEKKLFPKTSLLRKWLLHFKSMQNLVVHRGDRSRLTLRGCRTGANCMKLGATIFEHRPIIFRDILE